MTITEKEEITNGEVNNLLSDVYFILDYYVTYFMFMDMFLYSPKCIFFYLTNCRQYLSYLWTI